ncbi:MAG: 30S ribosomal protein S18 [Alicyclobacillaceae bacterium]|nr:30S ribosomal protein S18 [Alicyclobacillaceae bacterium]
MRHEARRKEDVPVARKGRGGKRRRVCNFCVDKIDRVDYKDADRLRKYMTERGKILPRRISGNCARHQRQVTVAIKRARQVALLPFTVE